LEPIEAETSSDNAVEQWYVRNNCFYCLIT